MQTALKAFLETAKQNVNYFKFTDVIQEYIFKLTSINAEVRQWFYAKKKSWDWLIAWNKEFK